MSAIVLRTNANTLTVKLKQFQLGLEARAQLMQTIGMGQLVSIRRTFAEEGSPAGSWAPLSPATRRWGGKRYSAGHKLLVLYGLLLNSIAVQAASATSVSLGTNLPRARVHQFGFDGTQSVSAFTYSRGVSSRNRSATASITNKAGRKQTVTRKTVSGVSFVSVKGFTRRLRIPARPFLVFRPEDPARIETQVLSFVKTQAGAAGLEMV